MDIVRQLAVCPTDNDSMLNLNMSWQKGGLESSPSGS